MSELYHLSKSPTPLLILMAWEKIGWHTHVVCVCVFETPERPREAQTLKRIAAPASPLLHRHDAGWKPALPEMQKLQAAGSSAIQKMCSLMVRYFLGFFLNSVANSLKD